MTRRFLPHALLIFSIACASRAPLPPPREPLSATPLDALPSEPPPPTPVRSRAPLDFHEIRLHNGLTLWIVQDPTAPLVAFRFASRGANESGARPRMALLCGEMIPTRTLAPDGTVHERWLEELGYRFSVGTVRDGTVFALTVPSELGESSLELLAHTVRRPHFEQTPLDQLLFEFNEQDWVGRSLIRQWLRRQVFGAADVRSRLLIGPVPRVSVPEVQGFYRRTIGPSESNLVIVGDVSVERARVWAERAFGDWTSATDEQPTAPATGSPATMNSGPRVGVVATPGEQIRIFIGERAPPRVHPDHAGFLVVSNLLGGMFRSRLNLRVREEAGYSYGVHAEYGASRDAGFLMIGTAVEASRASAVVHEILNEMHRLSAQGPDAEEFSAARGLARQRVVGELVGRRNTANALATLFLMQLEPDAHSELIQAIDRLRPRDVQRVASQWLRSQQAPVVLAGPRGPLRAALGQLRLGPVLDIGPRPR